MKTITLSAYRDNDTNALMFEVQIQGQPVAKATDDADKAKTEAIYQFNQKANGPKRLIFWDGTRENTDPVTVLPEAPSHATAPDNVTFPEVEADEIGADDDNAPSVETVEAVALELLGSLKDEVLIMIKGAQWCQAIPEHATPHDTARAIIALATERRAPKAKTPARRLQNNLAHFI